eukprot:349759-Chlamydomonas_euryale.AAC.11
MCVYATACKGKVPEAPAKACANVWDSELHLGKKCDGGGGGGDDFRDVTTLNGASRWQMGWGCADVTTLGKREGEKQLYIRGHPVLDGRDQSDTGVIETAGKIAEATQGTHKVPPEPLHPSRR